MEMRRFMKRFVVFLSVLTGISLFLCAPLPTAAQPVRPAAGIIGQTAGDTAPLRGCTTRRGAHRVLRRVLPRLQRTGRHVRFFVRRVPGPTPGERFCLSFFPAYPRGR